VSGAAGTAPGRTPSLGNVSVDDGPHPGPGPEGAHRCAGEGETGGDGGRGGRSDGRPLHTG
jgi:hypothetical protein